MPVIARSKLAPLVLLLAVVAVPPHAGAAPAAQAWPRWEAHDPAATLRVDHEQWGQLLARYVRSGHDGVNRFAYREVVDDDRRVLERYLDDLAATPIRRYARDEQLAFWINLYNALTVDVVLRHYPVASIRDIDVSPGFFSDGPWGKKLISVEGEPLSLDDIEHRILRPIWRDPRIHYAVNCASIGCPDLLDRPFTAADTERLLEFAARRYVNHPRGASIVDGQLVVSSIYEWFKSDFGGDDASVIRHLAAYAEPGLRERLHRFHDIGDDRYDWSLNDAT